MKKSLLFMRKWIYNKATTNGELKVMYLGLLVMLPFMAITFWFYDKVNGFDLDCISWGYAVAVPLLILCLITLHELIHGIYLLFKLLQM